VHLDAPIAVSRYAQLPSVELVERLRVGQPVTVVGYGVQGIETGGGPPQEVIFETCFGDSGGPVLLGDTILAVNSFVTNGLCRGVTYAYRLDTPEARAFIASVP
jgi:hypothetical protein